ncbi:ABC transporter ATP-binding protein [bacterium]|nr:ABC transporter ATP-binding protein [bacterium]
MQLKINNLSKTYPNGVQALKGVSLTIGKGMFGLLGQNGSGKSTLMRTIATLQDADSGEIYFDTINVFKQSMETRKKLGYLPQEFGLYDSVTAFEMLDYLADIKGMSKKNERKGLVNSLLQKVNLYAERDSKLGTFSGGMKQRFGIAQALIGNPELIIVDEPTAGLDPAERKRFYSILSELGEDAIVILSTHIVEDVTSLCHQMAVIGHGKMLVTGIPQDIIDSVKGKIWEKEITAHELPDYENKFKVTSSHLKQGKMSIDVYSDEQPDASFRGKEPDLEDAYFTVIHPGTNALAGV